jgi:hypothetical protein
MHMHRWIRSNQLFIEDGGVFRCCDRSSRSAFTAFISGLMGASPPSLAALRERADQHKEKSKQLLELAMEPLPATKKPRLDD